VRSGVIFLCSILRDASGIGKFFQQLGELLADRSDTFWRDLLRTCLLSKSSLVFANSFLLAAIAHPVGSLSVFLVGILAALEARQYLFAGACEGVDK